MGTPLSQPLLFGGLVDTAGAIAFARDCGHWMAPRWQACALIGALADFLAAAP
jgi:hypothetical protein